MTVKNVLLVEPGYRNKYPPLGLMKIAAYHRGRGDSIRFVKGEQYAALRTVWDRVYVTTLFSFEWRRIAEAIDFAVVAAGSQNERVFVGGVAASLMYEEFVAVPRWAGIRFIAGLLDGAPAKSLHLSTKDGDFGAADSEGTPIEFLVPDYGILQDISYVYPVRDAYFAYASRGCIRKCRFCGVPKLEGSQKEMPPLRGLVEGIAARYGEKRDLILMDNNIAAAGRYREVIAEIRTLGFERGATLARNGRRIKRRVDFNQGVDARILAQSPMYLREMATICVSPLRIAFDHMGVRKVYEKSVRMAAENGIDVLSNYMLYNFMDTPEDLYARMRLNVKLREQLGVRLWSFPMRYQPVNLKDRSHVGRHWNKYVLRSFQIMLQATHGVVSGNREFFEHAYGESREKFLRLLSLPHRYIFARDYYEAGDGGAEREQYERLRAQLTRQQEEDLRGCLAGMSRGGKAAERYFDGLSEDRTIESDLRRILAFYGSALKRERIARRRKPQLNTREVGVVCELPPVVERVEDAGLYAE